MLGISFPETSQPFGSQCGILQEERQQSGLIECIRQQFVPGFRLFQKIIEQFQCGPFLIFLHPGDRLQIKQMNGIDLRKMAETVQKFHGTVRLPAVQTRPCGQQTCLFRFIRPAFGDFLILAAIPVRQVQPDHDLRQQEFPVGFLLSAEMIADGFFRLGQTAVLGQQHGVFVDSLKFFLVGGIHIGKYRLVKIQRAFAVAGIAEQTGGPEFDVGSQQ